MERTEGGAVTGSDEIPASSSLVPLYPVAAREPSTVGDESSVGTTLVARDRLTV